MHVRVAPEHRAHTIALDRSSIHSLDPGRHGIDRRIPELVSTRAFSRREPVLGSQALDFNVAELCEPSLHPSARGEDPGHRPTLSLDVDDRLGQVHEAATLGIDRCASRRKFPERRLHRRVRRQCGRVQLRVSAAKVNPIQFRRQRTIRDWAEFDELRAEPSQQTEVVLVVEAESGVAGDADARAHRRGDRRRHRLNGRRRPIGGQLQQALEIQMGLYPVRQLDDPFAVQGLVSEMKAEMALWNGEPRIPWEVSDRHGTASRRDPFTQQLVVPDACYSVAHHGGQRKFRDQRVEAVNDGGCASGDRGAIEHEHNRSIQPERHFGGRACQ